MILILMAIIPNVLGIELLDHNGRPGGSYNLTILYTNDIFKQFHDTEGPNGTLDFFSELTNLKLKQEDPAILVNPGNVLYKPKIKSWEWYMERLNSLPISAGGLSWFKDANSLEEMTPIFKLSKHPILACNLHIKDPLIQKYIKPSHIMEINGRKLGIIGYISQEKRRMYPDDDDLGFTEEARSISKECEKLRSSSVHIVIAMGFSDFITDLRIAESVECIDVVIGSSSKLFTWRGEPMEVFGHKNPVMVENFGKKIIPVTQQDDKCLGELHLSFNEEGKLLSLGSRRFPKTILVYLILLLIIQIKHL